MASNSPSHETHLEEGLLPVVANEKRTLLTDTSPPGPGYPHAKHQKPQRTRTSAMAMARRFLIFAVCFFVSISLASVVSPHLRCSRHQHHGDYQGALSEAHADGAELSEPVNAPEPDMLHRLLHAYFPKAFQDGVYPSDQDALSAVEAEDAGLASTVAHLAKRQDGNDTEPTPSPTPSDRTTERTPEPSPTEPSTTEPPPPPPSPTTSRPPPPPPPSPSTSAPPPPPPPPPPSPTPSSSRPPPPPPPPPPSTSSRPPPPPPPPSSEPTRSPTSSAAEPSDSGSSASSEEETSTTTSSSSRRTSTRSSASFESSSEVITTRTSTDADGDITIITETSFVGVDPTPQTTGGSDDNPNLQNAGPRNGAAAGFVLAAGLMAAGAALLL